MPRRCGLLRGSSPFGSRGGPATFAHASRSPQLLRPLRAAHGAGVCTEASRPRRHRFRSPTLEREAIALSNTENESEGLRELLARNLFAAFNVKTGHVVAWMPQIAACPMCWRSSITWRAYTAEAASSSLPTTSAPGPVPPLGLGSIVILTFGSCSHPSTAVGSIKSRYGSASSPLRTAPCIA
jgi:hypothetical protein